MWLKYEANSSSCLQCLKTRLKNIYIFSENILCSLFSPCWMSPILTAQPTARQHSSIKKTSGSMRRGSLQLWSKAGLTPNAEVYALALRISYFNLSFTSSWLFFWHQKSWSSVRGKGTISRDWSLPTFCWNCAVGLTFSIAW